MQPTPAWELIHHVLEAMGLFFIPFVGWNLLTLLSHSKQIVVLESKVNEALSRRMISIENKVEALETKIDAKISSIEHNVVDCKLSLYNLIVEKFDHLLRTVEVKDKK